MTHPHILQPEDQPSLTQRQQAAMVVAAGMRDWDNIQDVLARLYARVRCPLCLLAGKCPHRNAKADMELIRSYRWQPSKRQP